jgi:hypothetical protein
VIILLINIKKPVLSPLNTRNDLKYTSPEDILGKTKFCGHTISIGHAKDNKKTMILNVSLLLAPWAEYVEFGLNGDLIKISIDIKNNEISFIALTSIETRGLDEFPNIINPSNFLRRVDFAFHIISLKTGTSIQFIPITSKNLKYVTDFNQYLDIDYWWCGCNAAINYYTIG